MDRIVKEIRDNELGQIFENENMKYHCSMRCGADVRYLYIPDTLSNLTTVLKMVHDYDVNYKVIGRGSNTLFMGDFIDIFVIKISNCLDFLEINENSIRVGAGYSTQKLAKYLSKDGYSGLEFAGGIPGAIGGLVYMNGGAHTSDVSEIIDYVEAIDNEYNVVKFTKEECNFAYRHSVFQENNMIIVSVALKMDIKDPAAVFKRMSGNLAYRKEMQPLQLPSCGSVFRNPEGFHAGKLIEDCGLKGYKIGGAQVSEKHANFIVNMSNAKCEDVINLIKHVQEQVFEKYGIELKTEIEVIGQ